MQARDHFVQCFGRHFKIEGLIVHRDQRRSTQAPITHCFDPIVRVLREWGEAQDGCGASAPFGFVGSHQRVDRIACVPIGHLLMLGVRVDKRGFDVVQNVEKFFFNWIGHSSSFTRQVFSLCESQLFYHQLTKPHRNHKNRRDSTIALVNLCGLAPAW